MSELQERVPRYAMPWLDMGKMRERRRWQAYSLHLLNSAASFQFRSLRASVTELYHLHHLPPIANTSTMNPSGSSTFVNVRNNINRFRNSSTTASAPPTRPPSSAAADNSAAPAPDLSRNLLALIDTAESNVSKLFVNYIQMIALDHEGASYLNSLTQTT